MYALAVGVFAYFQNIRSYGGAFDGYFRGKLFVSAAEEG